MLAFLFRSTSLSFFTQPLWRDEAFTVILARLPVRQLLIGTAQDSNPPLYYLLLKVWMLIFGTSEVAVRSFSVLCFAFVIYGFYLLLSHFFHRSLLKNIPWLVLIIINPLLLYYAFEARMYMLLAALSVFSWYALLKKRYIFYIIFCVLGILTHYFFILLLIGQCIYGFRQKKKQFIKIICLIFLACLPWFIFLRFHMNTSYTSFWLPMIQLIDIAQLPAIVFFGFERVHAFSEIVVKQMNILIWTVSIVGWLIAGYIILRKQKKSPVISITFIGFCWVVIPISITLFASFFIPLLLPRYLIFVSVGILFVLPILFQRLPKIIAIILFFFLLYLNLQYLFYQVSYRMKGNTAFYQATKEINAMIRPHDVVYVTNDLDYFTARYYFLDHPVFIYNKKYEDIPWFVGKALISRNAIRTTITQYPSYTFLLDSNGIYKIVTQQ